MSSDRPTKTAGAKENVEPNKGFSSTDSLLVLPRVRKTAAKRYVYGVGQCMWLGWSGEGWILVVVLEVHFYTLLCIKRCGGA